MEFCLCADDFGISPAVSRGILEAVKAGRLTATSALVTRPSCVQFATDLRACSNIDIGLHLNLTLAEPLTKMPRFAPAQLPEIGRVLRGARNGDLPLDEIGQEIEAQIEAFTTTFGRAPDFVDGHQHVHVFAGVRESLLGALARKGLAGRLWLRDSGDRPARILARRIELTKALGVAWFARGFAQAAAKHGFATNEGFAGFSAFRPKRDFARDFSRYLIAPGERHLVMCHPGHVDAELATVDSVTTTRETELAFLLSSRFSEVLAEAGARLTRLSRSLV